eukprot:TRINITY_DN18776_c0_g1_i1.p1 TRINITY_DN18776_c0_g1~~TRINITY_DN18776_c0_g1_i1.p1  ORF type:complete len:417 (+),score=54.99 TRINITY_DN18776_c0_g1_i1:37-1287(+)
MAGRVVSPTLACTREAIVGASCLLEGDQRWLKSGISPKCMVPTSNVRTCSFQNLTSGQGEWGCCPITTSRKCARGGWERSMSSRSRGKVVAASGNNRTSGFGGQEDVRLRGELVAAAAQPRPGGEVVVVAIQEPTTLSASDQERLRFDRRLNAAIVLLAGGWTLSKILALDSGYYTHWNIVEIARSIAIHNWSEYEAVLAQNPVLTKMVTSGIVYSLGDWSAQTVEGKGLLEFDRMRILRSGLIGFTLHGSLSHYYYHLCERLFPWEAWWVVLVKVVFDQTAWSFVWNSIYYSLSGALRGEKLEDIYEELKETSIPLLQAGWKLWPAAHLVTYGVIPVEQRLLWVDMVELVWVTILSTYSNKKVDDSAEDPAEAMLLLEETDGMLPLHAVATYQEAEEMEGSKVSVTGGSKSLPLV